ncbi:MULTISPECIES: YihY/virulence factor BrkB family protein [Halococcus]|uniref:Ribonuclease BN n=1 Tax=Halococcus salifodinae DSM 8989 TaxID=1227456 RepID=M0N7K3_9EURY|nr:MULTISPECIES: YihY/virulence factor BrkB family protein [Halococcus]EMA52650.1 ribonuclease BN [Halococcus salifodinae DSM 8989]
MNVRSSRPARLARATIAEVRENHLTFMAGSLAFYAFVSLVPLFVLAFVAASVVGGEAFATRITDLLESTLTESARDLLADVLTDSSGQTGASAIGLVTLLWSGLKLFRGLDIAFDAVYGVRRPKSLLAQLRDGAIVLLGVGLAVGVIVVTGAAFALFPTIPYVEDFHPLLLVVGLSLTFLPLYYFLPDVDVSMVEVLPGTVLAALGWTVTEFAFQFYVAYAGQYAAYGVIGGVLLVLIWLYYSALVLLLGAVVNVVFAGRSTHLGDERAPLDDSRSADTTPDGGRWRW